VTTLSTKIQCFVTFSGHHLGGECFEEGIKKSFGMHLAILKHYNTSFVMPLAREDCYASFIAGSFLRFGT
jgi:hypothetical protein